VKPDRGRSLEDLCMDKLLEEAQNETELRNILSHARVGDLSHVWEAYQKKIASFADLPPLKPLSVRCGTDNDVFQSISDYENEEASAELNRCLTDLIVKLGCAESLRAYSTYSEATERHGHDSSQRFYIYVADRSEKVNKDSFPASLCSFY
jgi:hypothetical protein